MYLLWIFSDARQSGKAYTLPAQPNWSGRLDISRDILGENEAVNLPVSAENGRWSLGLPEGYAWEDKSAAPKEITHDGILKMRNELGALTIIASRYGRQNTVMHKHIMPRQELTIGKSEGCMIRYNKPLVSGTHATVRVQGRNVVFTDRSVNGSWVNGRRVVNRSINLQGGDQIFIAPALRLIVTETFFAVNTVDDLTVSDFCGPMAIPMTSRQQAPEDLPITCEYHRAPRLKQQPNTEEVTIDPPLEKERNKNTPAWLTIGPSMTMILPMLVSTLVMGRSMGASLVMIGTSSALSIMWSTLNRKYTEKEAATNEANRQKICRQYYAEIEERLIAETDREKKRLNLNYLPVTECVRLPASGDHRMWERLPHHDDFLVMRLGVGEKKLPFNINVQKLRINMVDDPLRHEPQRLKDVYQMMKDAPIVLNPREHRIIGVLGNKSSPWMMQSMVAQLAASHSYHDVRIIVIHDERNADQWKFTHRLPHVYAADDRTLRMSVCTPQAIHEVLSYFDNVLKIRLDMQQATEKEVDPTDLTNQIPWYMFFVTDPKLIEDQPILRYLNQPGLGFTLVMQAAEMESLPKECDLIIEARTQLGTVFQGDGTMTGVSFETVDLAQLQNFANGLAPFRIREMVGDTSIPSLVTFLESYGVRNVEDLDVCRNWSENHAWVALKTILGLKAGSTPFVLDISDKNHGPHGLIAGTTGAGKSVLLQSFILSLSLNYNPSEIQFILIDYKGGGTSESFRELPHVAGIIDSSEGARTIFRALASIRGEIKRREAIFKDVGVNNIDDYMKLFNADPAEETLAHLIIIVDEFAELKKEEPEFMHELVSAARVGRSLGMHLVLATQKPGNSVSDEIDANTRFRICLRVASRGDSTEMIKHPDAAYLKGMGRCYVRVGSDEVYEQVQTSWSGATYNPEALRPEEEPRILNDAGQPIKFRKKKKAATNEKQITELDVVLDYIRRCCDKYQYDWAKAMWLKEMPATLLLDELYTHFDRPRWDGRKWNAPLDENLNVLYGMADDINTQQRIPAAIDFNQARNILLAGLPGSGKTTALQTMAVALAEQYSPEDVNIYVFSLTSHMLQCLENLPHVGEIVYEEEGDEQLRLMNMIYAESERRKKLFRELATDNYIQYNRSAANSSEHQKVPAIVVMIDRMQQLRDWDDGKRDVVLQRFYDMLRSAASQGIFFVMTCFGRNELPIKYHPFVRAITLLQNERADYADALGTRVSSEWGGIREFPGRGMIAVEDKEAKETFLYEMQVAAYSTVSSDKERADAILALGKEMSERWQGPLPQGIARIPQKPTLEQMLREPSARNAMADRFRIPFGYIKAQGTVASADLSALYSGLFIGPKKSGKTTLLQCMAVTMRKKGYDVFLIGADELVAWGQTHGIPTFAHGSPQWLEQFGKITQTNKLRSAALTEAGAISVERKKEVAASFNPIVILIDDMDKFMAAYEKEANMINFLKFCVQDNDKIASFKLFTYATVTRKGLSSGKFKEPLSTMNGVRRGMMLQGVTYDCDPFGVSGLIPGLKKQSELPRGEAFLVMDDDAVHIVLPQLELSPEETAEVEKERG